MVSVLRPVFILTVTLALVALPFVLDGFAAYQLTMAIIYAVAIMGLVLLTGHSGQVSLGHSAFMAVGAYTAALLMQRGGWPLAAALPAAGGVAFAFGLAFAYPATRLRVEYVALVTFVLAVATPQILKAPLLEPLTNGVRGMMITRGTTPPGWLSTDQWLFFHAAITAALLQLGCWWLTRRHPFGRAMLAVRDQPVAAAAVGISVAWTRTLAFGLSALCAGVAGGLYAGAIQFIGADSFGATLSITLFVRLVVGGLGSLAAAFAGGLFVLYVPDFAAGVSLDLASAVYGGLLLLAVIAMPNGVAGAMSAAVRIVSRQRTRP